MTIVYFSGTGNSKYVAMRLAEKEGTLLYLPDLIQEGRTTIKDDVIGIVSPTYFWGASVYRSGVPEKCKA